MLGHHLGLGFIFEPFFEEILAICLRPDNSPYSLLWKIKRSVYIRPIGQKASLPDFFEMDEALS